MAQESQFLAVTSVPPFRATVADLGSALTVVSVSGELDLHVGPELRASLDSAEGCGARTVVVDLSRVCFLDSTICGLLVGEAKRRRRAGGELLLVSSGTRATQALELAGIDRVVRMCATLDEAMEAVLAEASA